MPSNAPDGLTHSPPRSATRDDADADDFLGPLLHTLAESLDVREIFTRISVEARRIVPHDFLLLGLISEDHQRVRVTALSDAMPRISSDVGIPDPLRLAIEKESFIVSNAQLEPGG